MVRPHTLERRPYALRVYSRRLPLALGFNEYKIIGTRLLAPAKKSASQISAILVTEEKLMTAGDEVRSAARKTRVEAQQNRNQAADMQRLGEDLKRVADEQDSQATTLDQQAKDTDDAELRAQQSIDELK